MKIWYCYSSEHSSDIAIVAEFKTAEDLSDAVEVLSNINKYKGMARKSEKDKLFTPHDRCYGEEYEYEVGKNNKILFSTEAYFHTTFVDLFLSLGASVTALDDNDKAFDEILNDPDLKEALKRMHYIVPFAEDGDEED